MNSATFTGFFPLLKTTICSVATLKFILYDGHMMPFMYILQYWNDFSVNEKNLADIALKVWNHFLVYEEVMIAVDFLQV